MWPFSSKKKDKKSFLRMRWDAASMSPEMRKHFQGADNLSADQSLSHQTRKTIASRVRLEVENNAFCAGIVSTLTNHCIGRGVGIQLELDKGVAAQADLIKARQALDAREKRFRAWADVVGLDRLLRICRRARCCDGEVFVALTENKGLRSEVKLCPVAYESGQVSSAASNAPVRSPDGELIEFDGVRYDRWGNPVSYCLQNNLEIQTPGSWVSAEFVLHYANILRPGQHRGVSELASSIAVFNDVRRFSNATLAAAEAASELSFVIETDLTSVDDDGQRVAAAVDAGTFVESARSGGIALPEGWKISQLTPTNPTTNYVAYLESKVREAARCLNMPLMIALADSSSANYSSSRADQQLWARSVDVDRQELVRAILQPIYERWEGFDRAIHSSDYDYAASPRWQWQPFVSIDPVKDEQAAKLRLENRTSNLAIECGRLGLDWEQVILQQAREQAMAEELGLIVPQEEIVPDAQEN